MTRVLLDTSFLIDAERGVADLDALLADDDDVAIAAITVAEVRVGALLADDQHRPSRESFVDGLVATLPVLPYDIAVAAAHAHLLAAVCRSGRPRGAHDLIIAATARSTHRTVITADPVAFADLPEVQVRSHRTSRLGSAALG